ncbi:hypothetical protein V8C37DRAFT_86782 [Trichoderma ceciliae]
MCAPLRVKSRAVPGVLLSSIRTGRKATVGRSMSGTDRSTMYFMYFMFFYTMPRSLVSLKSASASRYIPYMYPRHPLVLHQEPQTCGKHGSGEIRTVKRSPLFRERMETVGNTNFGRVHSRRLPRNATELCTCTSMYSVRITSKGERPRGPCSRRRNIAELNLAVCSLHGAWNLPDAGSTLMYFVLVGDTLKEIGTVVAPWHSRRTLYSYDFSVWVRCVGLRESYKYASVCDSIGGVCRRKASESRRILQVADCWMGTRGILRQAVRLWFDDTKASKRGCVKKKALPCLSASQVSRLAREHEKLCGSVTALRTCTP